MTDCKNQINLSNSPSEFPAEFKLPSIERMIKQNRIIAEHKDDPYNAVGIIFNETAKLFVDESRENIPDVRDDLGRCVAMLRSMYPEKVASIDGLPVPSDVQCFDYSRLKSLIDDLGERYFPTREDIEAA